MGNGGQGKPNWLLSLLFGPSYGKPNVKRMQEERDVSGLIDALSYREYAISWAAQTALIELGAPAVEPLIDRIPAADTMLRIHIARILGQIADARAIEPLVRLSKEGHVNLRQTAVGGLVRFDTMPALTALCEALADEDGGIQEAATKALEAHADGRIVAKLIRMAQNPKASVGVQTVLRLALDRAAATVSTEDLRQAALLNDSYVLIFAQAETSCSFTTYNTTAEACDFSQIKQMARQELIRRGLEA